MSAAPGLGPATPASVSPEYSPAGDPFAAIEAKYDRYAPAALPGQPGLGRPLLLTLWAYPLWWALGLQMFAWPLASAVMLVRLFLNRAQVIVPRGFGLWLLFLCWTVLGVAMLDSADRLAAWGYREMLYVAATALLIALVNLDEEDLPTPRLARALVGLWYATVVAGFIGIVAPGLSFRSLAEHALPSSLTGIAFVHDQIHPRFGDQAEFLGTVRPAALYSYTNSWGAALAMLTPLAIYGLTFIRSHAARVTFWVTAAASLVPIIVSVNRGLWVGVLVAAVVVAVRSAIARRPGLLLGILAAMLTLFAAVWFTPLRDVVIDRLNKPNVSTRETLVSASLHLLKQSPLIGYGAPVSITDLADSNDVSVGTHGQLWTLLVSHGVPGTAFYFGFFLVILFATWRIRPAAWWAHAGIVVFVTQAPFYNALPVPLMLAMVASAICLRERSRTRGSSLPAYQQSFRSRSAATDPSRTRLVLPDRRLSL